MSELPSGWTLCSLKDIAAIQSGIGFPEKYQGINNEKYPVYKVGDISRAYLNANGILAVAANYVSFEVAVELKGKLFPVGSTVFAKIGEALKLNRRAYVIKEGLADNNVMGVISDLSESNKYIYRFLQNFNIAALSRSTTVPSIRKSDLEEIEVPMPPLNEQIRIADKLDSVLAKVDAAQARLEKIPTLLKRFRQSVLAAATSGELTREWRDARQPNPIQDYSVRAVAERKNKGIKESKHSKDSKVDKEPFEIPHRWVWVRLGHIALKITDGAHNTPPILEAGYPYLMAKDLTCGTLDFSENRYISEKDHRELHNKCMPEIGDLLVVNIGAGTGNNVLITVDFEFSFKNIAIIKRPSFVVAEYLKYFFDAEKKRIFDEQTRGGAQPFLSLTVLNELPFALPPLEEQKEIVRRVESLFALADAVEKQYLAAKQRLDRLTQSLLAKAFRGELVPQDPNDEPAAELLKRIQAERQAQAPAKRNQKQSA